MGSKEEFLKQMEDSFTQLTEIMTQNSDLNRKNNEVASMIKNIVSQNPPTAAELIQEYQGYLDQLLAVMKKYENQYDELESETAQKTDHMEYASGSKYMYRGFYCPSPVIERLVGGYKRGKKMKMPRQNSKSYYAYHFDAEENLICCEKYENGACYDKEFLVRDKNCVYGILFHEFDHSVCMLSMEVYSEQHLLQHYMTVLPDLYSGMGSHSIETSEKYEYDDQQRLTKVTYVIGGIPGMGILREEVMTEI